MFAYPYAALITGLLLMTAGGLTLTRHFLLEPMSGKYPKAPSWLRHSMFGFAAVLVLIGLQFVWAFVSDAPNVVPPQPTPAMQLLSVALVIHKACLLANILRQRYPEDVWARLNAITERLFCKNDRPLWNWLNH